MDFNILVDSQRRFFRSGSTRDIGFRIEALRKLRSALRAKEGLLFEAIARDFGKSQFDTYATELGLVCKEIDRYIRTLPKLSRPRRVRTDLLNLPGRSRIYRDPLGCTLIIGAWNYPYNLTLIPLVAAIAAGNTCILKPSELAPNSMHALAEVINGSFPEEYLRVVFGGVEQTTELLKLRFDKIFFTGSPRVGRIVYEAAAKHLTPVTLELGGKSPAIVTRSADMGIAARRIVWGKFLNAGQTCIAPDYVLVDRDVKDAFLSALHKELNAADYAKGAPHYTRIINRGHFDRLVGLIDPSKVICGGGSDAGALYIEPTVMDGVTWDDAVMREEIFGPVLPVLTFTEFTEALDAVLDREKPLSAYLFSGNKAEKRMFTGRLSFGGGCINDTVMHFTNGNLPFGGVGNSGMGSYHGKYGFDAFSHHKPVLTRAGWGETDTKYPPYTAKKARLLRLIFGK